MRKAYLFFIVALVLIFILDQSIKWFFVLSGFGYEGGIISLVLVYNKGVAFSMFAFLQEWLKYLQILLILGIFFYLYKNKEFFKEYSVPLGMIFGAGISNVFDRFLHLGVVDYIFWHYLFEFAIFNFADVMINCGVVWILLQSFLRKPKRGN
ncbi:signal peptidase II [Helicobacter mesocricetorum]|uniref:signal peptidase II n=1 Tax=Helicobacter mesocricetorum TaxID=87012 RepID=UPI000CF15B60|nr:signal peptidase II [Helicobacter mesocricetorum]